MTWRVISDNKKLILEAENNSPFYVSVSSVYAGTGKSSVRADGKMIDPFGKATYTFAGKNSTINKFKYFYINDYGASISVERGI
ncbi:hypothetical protein [Mixta calida]|uniref:fimbrial biogenesis chaperone n=1 Tax=Mixta calida TaxID=665913 RepID=UPI00403ACD57